MPSASKNSVMEYTTMQISALLQSLYVQIFKQTSPLTPLRKQRGGLDSGFTPPLRLRRGGWGERFLRGLLGLLSLIVFSVFSLPAFAADEIFPPGAYIVDMGQATQTVANGLKPYGLVYELAVKQGISVKWAINATKSRGGVDFTANGKSYKGSAFIIPAELAAQAASSIATWKTQGVVVDGPITSSFTAPIYATIDSFPNAVLDLQKGSIAQAYYTNAGIPASTTGAFGSFTTYRFGTPASLTSCDDIYVMPHADPAWSTHQNLIPFNQSKGFIWSACHAVSVMERLDDTGDADTLPNMNFLSHIPPAITNTLSLKLFTTQSPPTVGPYQYADTTLQVLPYGLSTTNIWAYPVMQFLGKIDLASQNGSEQIYVPNVGAQWRSSTAIAVYDDNNADPVVLPTKGIAPPSSQIKAAKMVFGPGFGDPNNGMVMYEAGHNLAGATGPDNVAGQRAFFNYVLLAGIVRGLDVNVSIPAQIGAGQTVNVSAAAIGGTGLYSYHWYSSCGGTFSNVAAASTPFTAPATNGACTVRVVVSDTCTRKVIGLSNTVISGPQADLAIAKTDGQTSVGKGSPITYTITVTNNGPSAPTSLTVSDTLPATILTPTFTPSTGTYNSTTGLWTGLTLGSGQSITLTVKGTVSASATVGSSLTNTATVSPPAGTTDSVTTNNTATDTDTIIASTADLSVEKTDNQTQATKDNLISYTITVTNQGPSTVTSVTMTDTFFNDSPLVQNNGAISNITATPSTGTLSTTSPSSGTAFTWSGLTLAPGQSATLTFAGKVAIDQTKTPLRNVISVAPAGGITDPTPTNNTVFDENTVIAKIADADLEIKKAATSTSIVPGNPVTYTLTVTNKGPDPVNSMTVKDTLPPEILAPISFTPSAGTYNSATGLWSGLTLANNGTVTLTVTGIVDPTLPANQTIVNSATVQTPAGVRDSKFGNNDATDNLVKTATPQADLSINKTDNQTQAAPGSPITYDITVTNNGPSTITNVKVTDAVPSSITSTTFTASAGSYTTSTGAWTGLSLAKGQSVKLTLAGTLSASATGSLTNTATVAAPSGVTDPDNTNNSSTDTDTIVPLADLSIAKSDDQTSAIPGNPIGYVLTVTNKGPSTVTSVMVNDAVPATILNSSFAPSTGSYVPATGQWTGLNLAAGNSVTLILQGTVAPNASGTLANTATVAPPTGTTDPINTDNSSTDTDTLTPKADVGITKTDGQSAINPGESITYTVRVSNNGPSTASNVTVTDNIPADITNVSWTCTIPAGTGSCGAANGSGNTLNTTANLNPGAIATYIIQGTLSPSAPNPGSLTNTATVTLPTGLTDPYLSNNSVTDRDAVPRPGGSADLSITKTDDVTTIIPGSAVTYTIIVTNKGPGALSSVTVRDTLPADFLDPVFSTPYGIYDSSTGEWTVDLAASESATMIVDGTVSVAASGSLSNTVTVQTPAGFTDPDTTDNSSTDIDIILSASAPPEISLVKRITAINGNRTKNPNDNTALNTFVDGSGNVDNHPDWPTGYLQGAIDAGLVKPQDEVEYTIYFLSSGSGEAQAVKLCNREPTEQTLVPNAFNSTPQAPGGIAGDRAVEVSFEGSTLSYTTTNDGDTVQAYTSGTPLPAACGAGPNPSGAIVVNLGTGATATSGTNQGGTLAPATAPGVPSSSFGFIRFRARVN
jgi:uncharacterized repeat protein (TIGR01451 family)